MKKIFTLVLCMVVAVSAVTGCKKAEKNSKQGTETSATDNQNSGSIYPISKNGLTFKVFANLDAKVARHSKSFADMLCVKEAEKITGVKLEFLHPPVGQEKEQFNLMIASNDLPDMIYTSWTNQTGGIQKFAKDGQVIALNDYIDKYAPNFKKYLDSNKEAKKQLANDESNIHYFPNIVPEMKQRVFYGFQIRKDWLDKLDLKTPVTMDDWYKVLKAFKENDPNGNGKKDEIPFTTNKGFRMESLVWSWGIHWDMYQVDGKVKYGAVEPEYKEALAFIKKLYDEGLLDADYAIQDSKQMETKVVNGQTGAWYGLLSGQLGKYWTLVPAKDPKFNLRGVQYPKGAKGEQYTFEGDFIAQISGSGVAITSKCKNIKEAVQYLDFGYSPQGNTLYNFGEEGKSYNMVNGNPVFTEDIFKNKDGLAPAEALAKYSFSAFGWAMIKDPKFSLTETETPAGKARVEAQEVWAKANTSRIIPTLSFTNDENKVISTKLNEMNTYRDEMFHKFVMGKEPLSNYEEYVKRIKSLGLDDVIKAQQNALDRYNKR